MAPSASTTVTSTTLPTIANPLQAIRQTPMEVSYKVEFAWGGNICRLQNSSGSLLATASGSAGVNASKAINGNKTHYNPDADTYDDYATINYVAPGITANYLKIDFGVNRSFNEIRIFMAPFVSNGQSIGIYTCVDGLDPNTFANLVDFYNHPITGNVSSGILITRNTTQTTARYVVIKPGDAGNDGGVRVSQVEVYNWIDESAYVLDDGNGSSKIKITAKSDDSQNASVTPSDCSISLNNKTKRFSEMNSSSLIYGILQIDGKGSGVRSGVPVHITTSFKGPNTLPVKWSTFDGYITNDDNPGGSTGLTYDDNTGTLLVVAKSIYSLLDRTISVPVYNGWFLHLVIKDICYRCGIPEQFLNIDPIFQMSPYTTFSTTSGSSMIGDILTALPFSRVYETFNGYYTLLNGKNYGRTKMDGDLSLFQQPQGTIAAWCIDESKNKAYFLFNYQLASGGQPLGTPKNQWYQLFSWDMTQPIESGMSFMATYEFP